MTTRKFPSLDEKSIAETKDALHAYARVLGAWIKTCRTKRKHWWHASLRPSLTGLTTGVIHADADFEMELDMRSSQLHIRTVTGEAHAEPLRGQPAFQLADVIADFLAASGINEDFAAKINPGIERTKEFDGYTEETANRIARVFGDVAATMARFRAEIREEASPIQVWPHHFDLSMLWLPGEKVPDQDPENEESADKQMNFGFVLGDDSIHEPYLYVTAYPLPDGLANDRLPSGTVWQAQPFQGAVLLYKTLSNMSQPTDYLLDLWRVLLASGREHMLDQVA